MMTAKLNSESLTRNPNRTVDSTRRGLHFEIDIDGDRLVFGPVRPGAADAVHKKHKELGITDADIADAIAWALKCPAAKRRFRFRFAAFLANAHGNQKVFCFFFSKKKRFLILLPRLCSS